MALMAVTSLVERDGLVLAVWNRGQQGWSLPGGKVEPSERPEAAQTRELSEETGLITVLRELVYAAPSAVAAPDGARRTTHVFRVITLGEPQPVEGPVCWMTRKQLVAESPFGAFYRAMFEAIGP
jgi:ADP-ribose pyrophosphatase YjhB (NUDIX family)